MIKKSNTLYYAEEGKEIYRKSDGALIGSIVDLGNGDSIRNYTEKDKAKVSVAEPKKETFKEILSTLKK